MLAMIIRRLEDRRTDEVNNTARVTPLVVVPADELDEVGVKGDTSLGIEDGAVGVAVQVAGDNLVLGVAHDSYTRSALRIVNI